MKNLSIEIKAKSINQDKVREILKYRNVDFKGIDHQIDTYFKVNNGRLKLREGTIEDYLVHYKRENKEGQNNLMFYYTKKYKFQLKRNIKNSSWSFSNSR